MLARLYFGAGSLGLVQLVLLARNLSPSLMMAQISSSGLRTTTVFILSGRGTVQVSTVVVPVVVLVPPVVVVPPLVVVLPEFPPDDVVVPVLPLVVELPPDDVVPVLAVVVTGVGSACTSEIIIIKS